MVNVARIACPRTAPVSAWRPDGISTAINRFPGIVDEINGLTIGSGYDGGQSGTQEGIDKDVAGGEERLYLVGRSESNDRGSPHDPNKPSIHRCGIATQVGDRCEEDDMDSCASAMQQPGNNQSVSSVVSFSAENGNGFASYRPTVLLQMSDNAFAGALHQDGAGDMRFGDRAAIERLHLGSCHDLHRRPCVRDRYGIWNRVSAE